MRVRFWGTRGSIPTPGPRTLRYGGNTACVELRTDDGHLFILDCGTGLFELGRELAGESQPMVGSILLSHTHWDHTQGFAFFGPAYRKGNMFTVYAAPGVDRSLSDVLAQQMDYLNFPISLEERGAAVKYEEVGEETFGVDNVRVRTQYLNHTVLTLGFRIMSGGASVVYVADHEPFSPGLYRSGVTNPTLADIVHAGDRKHVDFLRDADLVIHDAQFTEAEFERRHNWGHGTAEYVVDVCVAAGVKEVALFHHDPDHDDALVERIESDAQERARARGSNLRVVAAAEGLVFNLPESADGEPGDETWHPSTGRPAQARILVADDEPGLVQVVGAVLAKDGYEILAARDGEEALEVIRREHPDLILLDVMMPKVDGYGVLRELRATPEFRDVPVIMLTAKVGEEDIVRSFEGGVTDYISKPAAPSLLRSRVRRWLLSQE